MASGDTASGAAWFTALTPNAVHSGAVISFSGDDLVATGAGIVAAVDAAVREHRAGDHATAGDGWLMDAVPLLSRGDARIVPLAWVPAGLAEDARRSLLDRAGELWGEIRSACDQRYGAGIALGLENVSARDVYPAELVRTGARRANAWFTGDVALVLVVYGGPLPAPLSSAALHVVPAQWVTDRGSRRRPAAGTDLSWRWEDAVAVAHTPESVTAGAVLAADAGQLVELARTLRAGRAATADRGAHTGVPVLERPPMTIVPLAWISGDLAPDTGLGRQLRQRAERSYEATYRACVERFGEPTEIAVPAEQERAAQRTETPYIRALHRAGVRRASVWPRPDDAVVLAAQGEPLTRLSLQVVPSAWVTPTGRSTDGGPATVDVDWSWADVVDDART